VAVQPCEATCLTLATLTVRRFLFFLLEGRCTSVRCVLKLAALCLYALLVPFVAAEGGWEPDLLLFWTILTFQILLCWENGMKLNGNEFFSKIKFWT